MIKHRLPQKGTPNKSQPRDMFQTPNYATDILIPFIPGSNPVIWECSSGNGKISQRLEQKGFTVFSSDINESDIYENMKLNFLTEEFPHLSYIACIITNPPYSLKRQFFNKCLNYKIPFALLISGDYSLWTIDAIRKYGCEKIVPDHRIDFITPTGLSGANGHSSYFHSYWLTYGFELGKSETFVELTKEMKKNI
jgi:hypothetical protein